MCDTVDLEIRTLAEGELITEPGFYSIPMHVHHNQPCAGYSVTSSVLRRMEKFGPAKVWLDHPDNPERAPRPDTKAMLLGRVMAAYIENGAEGIEEHVRVRVGSPKSFSVPEMMAMAREGIEIPKAPPNRPSYDQVVKYVEGTATPAAIRAVEYWHAQDSDHREIVTEADWELIRQMGHALQNDPAAQAALGGMPEITMAWQDAMTGIWCLARPDQTSFSGMLSDYKKVSTQGLPFTGWLVDRRISDHGYHMQMAFAAEGFEQLTQQWPDQVGLIFQEDVAPFDVILREVAQEELEIGRFQNQRALRKIHECMSENHWPGPGEDVGVYRMHPAQKERLIEEMQTAGEA